MCDDYEAEMSWDKVLTILTTKSDISKGIWEFENEVETMRGLQNIPQVWEQSMKWLNSLYMNDDARCEAHAKMDRERGNEVFKSKYKKEYFHLALEMYTKSIFLAPKGYATLPLSHANRAVLLMALKQYQDAYNDCQMAIDNNYPKENILKIYFRQAECSKMLGNKKLLAECIEKLENNMKNRKSQKYELEKLDELKSELMNLHTNKEIEKYHLETPILIEKKSKTLGRYIVTLAEIPKNNLIFSEKAFAFIPVYEGNLKLETRNPHYDCQYCATVNIIPFPCTECRRACYCSPNCRDSHQNIHKYECNAYKRNVWYLIGIAHLGIRTFLQGYESSLNKMENISDVDPKQLLDILLSVSDQEYEDYQYGAVVRLVTNFDKMDRTDLLQYAVTAYMLTLYLKEFTTFFEDLPEKCFKIMKEKKDWELYVGSLILRHIGQLVCNGHAISEMRTRNASSEGCLEQDSTTVKLGFLNRYIHSTRIFTAIFPKISMFNHSCDPNIRNCFNKDQLTVYATRDIMKNGEIFNCYGPHFKLMSNEERKIALKQQYCFDCRCEKCCSGIEESEIYQTFYCSNTNCNEELILKNTDLYTEEVVCVKCNLPLNLQWYKEIVAQFRNQVEITEEDCKILCLKLCAAYKSGGKIMSELNETRVDIAHMLLALFLEFSGLHEEIYSNLLDISLEMINIRKERFGVFSPEHIMACLFFLDLLAIYIKCTKNYNFSSVTVKILEDFKKSLVILSSKTREIFVNYLEVYLNEKL